MARVFRSVSRILSRTRPEPRGIFFTCLQIRGRKDFAGILSLQGTRVLQGMQGLNLCTCTRPRRGSARPRLVAFLGANKRLAACAATARMRLLMPCESAAFFFSITVRFGQGPCQSTVPVQSGNSFHHLVETKKSSIKCWTAEGRGPTEIGRLLKRDKGHGGAFLERIHDRKPRSPSSTKRQAGEAARAENASRK